DVDATSDGRSAVEMIGRSTYDLVFMDCQMPGMDGFEATAFVRALPSDSSTTPIIALTANAMAEDRERCLASGMNDYIAKPVTRAVLRDAVERWAST
ncbi:response regulator, partial [Myxococcota bacterium]|nr:response regulator [Myxococcota bacterium]